MESRASSTTIDLLGHSWRSWHAAPTPDRPAPTIRTSTVSAADDICCCLSSPSWYDSVPDSVLDGTIIRRVWKGACGVRVLRRTVAGTLEYHHGGETWLWRPRTRCD